MDHLPKKKGECLRFATSAIRPKSKASKASTAASRTDIVMDTTSEGLEEMMGTATSS